MIERGRYASPKIPVDDRLCIYCDLGEVEDEFHFMLKCKLYDSLRTQLISDMTDIYSNIDIDNAHDLFILIMCASDYDSIFPLIKYINSAFEKRSSIDK